MQHDYVGAFFYINNELQHFAHEEGRVLKQGSVFRYEYNLTDHLGNVRISFADVDEDGSIDETVEVLTSQSFYPFGLRHGGTFAQSGVANRYRYNGKELHDELGVGWYDYGARMYDPAVGRWNGVDLLAEDYSSWSPFNYVLGNPLKLIDPDGMRPATDEEMQKFELAKSLGTTIYQADDKTNQEKLRRVDVIIGGDPITDENGEVQYGYVKGYGSKNVYKTPLYRATVKGTDDEGEEVEETFTVIRFGVTDKKGKTAFTNGLADQQTHISRAWLDDYFEASSLRPTVSKGAWFIYGNFLLHDGTDFPTKASRAWATNGCVNFCGQGEFDKFNELIVRLSGTDLTGDAAKREIAKQEILYVTYQRAKRPSIKLHKQNR